MIPLPSTVSTPAADEYDDYYAGYVSLVRGSEPVPRLERQVPALRAACAAMSDNDALARYAPGKWSIKQVVGHLTDADRIFSYRLLRVGRGDATPLASFDENFYVDAGELDRRPLVELLDELEAARGATLSLIRGMRPEWWERRGVASGKPVSARAIVYITAGHVEHHFGILRERYGVPVPRTEGTRV